MSTDPMCKCLGVYGSSVSLSDIFCVAHVAPVWVGVGHLFLQLLAFTGHDCLLSGSLLGDLLHVWPLSSLLGSLLCIDLLRGQVYIQLGSWCLTFGHCKGLVD